MAYPRSRRSRAFKFVNLLSGDLTPSVATLNWTAIHASAFDLTLGAQIGDVMAVTMSFRYNGGNNTVTDAFTIVSSTPINGASGQVYSAAAGSGVGGMFHQQAGTTGKFARVMYTVTAGDLSATSTVTLRPYERQVSGTGTALTVFASTTGGGAYFSIENLGPPSPY